MIDIDEETLKIISCAFFISGLDFLVVNFCLLLWCQHLIQFTLLCTNDWYPDLGFWANMWQFLKDNCDD